MRNSRLARRGRKLRLRSAASESSTYNLRSRSMRTLPRISTLESCEEAVCDSTSNSVSRYGFKQVKHFS